MSASAERRISGCFFLGGKEQTYGKPKLHRQYLPQTKLESYTHVLADTATTTIKQEFTNASKKGILNLTYEFPLFAGVSVVAFAATFGKTPLKGVVRSNATAKQKFEQAKSEGKQAAIMSESKSSGDVFSTKLANIPAKTKVIVELTYLEILKPDVDLNGFRFTLPTSIAPRYGSVPQELTPTEDFMTLGGAMKIVVDVETPPENGIRSLATPSHPVQTTNGFLHNESFDGTPSFSKAHVTLINPTVELQKDFVLQFSTTKPDASSALLETYAHNPSSQAIMATIVPPSTSPTPTASSRQREVFFLCDRSGSMNPSRMSSLISAAQAFLGSLKTFKNTSFNIVSFGSNHKFMWPQSKPCNPKNCNEAAKLVQSFHANMGGTALNNALEAVFAQAKGPETDVEIIVLTDAEFDDVNRLKTSVKKAVDESNGAVRIFTLGIGPQVSHELLTSLAQLTNGFSLSTLENERLDMKTMAILDALETPHIKDYTVDVKYADGRVESVSQGQFTAAGATETGISFFSDDFVGNNGKCTETMKLPPRYNDSRSGRNNCYFMDYSDSDPEDSEDDEENQMDVDVAENPSELFVVPSIIQSPVKLPLLCRSNRASLYLLLRDAHSPVESIVLTSTLAGSDEKIVTEVPVMVLPEPGEKIHQLASKAFSKEMETKSGWLSMIPRNQKCEIDLFKTSLVRFGVHFNVANKETSFIAVADLGEDKQPEESNEAKKPESNESESSEAKAEDDSETLDKDWEIVPDYGYSSGTRGGGFLCSVDLPRSYNTRSYGTLMSADMDYDDSEDESEEEYELKVDDDEVDDANDIELNSDNTLGLLDLQDEDFAWDSSKSGAISQYCGLDDDYDDSVKQVEEIILSKLKEAAAKDKVVATLVVIAYLEAHQDGSRHIWRRPVASAREWLQKQFADGTDLDQVIKDIKAIQ